MLGSGPGGSVRDRTSEFLAVVDRLERERGATADSVDAQQSSDPASVSQSPSSAAIPPSEFARKAAAIGAGIYATSEKLGRLAALARRTSLFDDPAQEISELSTIVKQHITALNAAIGDLQVSSAAGRSGRQSADHSRTVVDQLRGRLKDTTASFKDVLTLRTDNLKAHDDRRAMFTASGAAGPGGGPSAEGRPGSASARRSPAFLDPASAGASFLPPNARLRRPGVGAGGPNGGLAGRANGATIRGTAATAGGSGSPLAGADPQQQQQQQLLLAQPQDTYLSSRAEAVRQVESTIAELGGIFQTLATMVHEQGEVAIRIDENMDDTLSNVDAGQAQLLKYLEAISGNRWLLAKVFGVLIIFLVFFITVVA